ARSCDLGHVSHGSLVADWPNRASAQLRLRGVRLESSLDVGPAGEERAPPAEDDLERAAHQLEPVVDRLLGRRRTVDLLGAADPAEDSVVVRRHELVPLAHILLDRARADLLDLEAGAPQRLEVVVERA